uniref:Uncharacterized protein n=1 Tax=Cryptomonas curvata TaxID=233186 RepID=A0A7S0Q967_9CRYP
MWMASRRILIWDIRLVSLLGCKTLALELPKLMRFLLLMILTRSMSMLKFVPYYALVESCWFLEAVNHLSLNLMKDCVLERISVYVFPSKLSLMAGQLEFVSNCK